MIALALGLPNMQTFAQTIDHPFGVGISFGISQYNGDLGSELFEFGVSEPGVQLYAGYFFNDSFDFTFSIDQGRLTYTRTNLNIPNRERTSSVNSVFGTYSVMARYRLTNGYILPLDQDFDPFISAGLSLTRITNFFDEKELSAAIPFGAGFNFMLLNNLSIRYELVYHRSFNDTWDGFADELNNTDRDQVSHDDHMIQTLGLVFHFGGSEYQRAVDTDQDGIYDDEDECPTEYGRRGANGCPDNDDDGIPNNRDACPSVAGPAATQGCPDRDGDGITDFQDACPYLAGTAALKGCPDRDGDGVPDYLDNCPNDPAATDSGCPSDQPLTVQQNTSQPDRDGDGVADAADKCPDTAGPANNEGCPEIDQSVVRDLANIVKNLQFNTGSSVIAQSSYNSLNKLVEIMKKNADAKLVIEGHTDSVGNNDKNLRLSQARADAVKTFLTQNGVSANRIRATGYGETRPVATNSTKEGRAQNRRVELRLEY